MATEIKIRPVHTTGVGRAFRRALVVAALTAFGCAEGGQHLGTGTGGSTGTGTGGTGAPAGGGATGSGGAGTPTGSGGVTGAGGGIAKIDLTGKKVLFVVDNATSLDDGEIVLKDHLVIGRDMVVTLADTQAVHPDAATMNLIIASSSASASEFPTLYKAVPVPMILFGNGTYQAMGIIAASSGKGTTATPAMLTIVTATTPLASALTTGTNFAAIGTDRDTSIYWGTPAGSPINVASVMGTPTQSCVFAYDKGAMMAAGTAPARRVGIGFKTDTVPDLSIESFRLMNAAIEWTATAPP